MVSRARSISAAMRDLHESGCDLLTLTQYLRPSPLHHPIDRRAHPEEFVEMGRRGRDGLRCHGRPPCAFLVPWPAGRASACRGFEDPRAAATHRELRLTLQEAGSLARLRERSEHHAPGGREGRRARDPDYSLARALLIYTPPP